MLRHSATAILVLLNLVTYGYAGEKAALTFQPPLNASVTYSVRQSATTNLEYSQDGEKYGISDTASTNSSFTITRTGGDGNASEYLVNIDTLRQTRNFGTGSENYRLEIDGDKIALFRNGKPYADTEKGLRLDVISEDQRSMSVTNRPVRIPISPSGKINGEPDAEDKEMVILRFFMAYMNRGTAFFGFRLPADAVAPGDNWSDTTAMDEIGRITFAKKTGPNLVCNFTFGKVETLGGRRLATVTLDAPLDISNLSSTMPGFDEGEKRIARQIWIRKLRRRLTGTLLHDLDENRPVRVELSAETEMEIVAGEENNSESGGETGKDESPGDGKKFTPKPPPPAPVITVTGRFHTVFEEKKK